MQPSEASPIRIASDVTIQMAFACENFSTDPFQRVTFHNIVDQLTSNVFPATTGMLFVVFSFQRDMAGFLMQCRVEILPESGDPIAAQNISDIAFKPDQVSQRAIVGFGAVTWPKPGMYTVRFTSRGETVASFRLRLAQVAPPPQMKPPGA